MTTLYLDGTKSYSQLGSTLTYLWAIASAPIGSTATLSSTTTTTVSFTPVVVGEYVVTLVVNDGTTSSRTEQILVYWDGYNAGALMDGTYNYSLPTNQTFSNTQGPAETTYSVPSNTRVQINVITDAFGKSIQLVDTITYTLTTLVNQYKFTSYLTGSIATPTLLTSNKTFYGVDQADCLAQARAYAVTQYPVSPVWATHPTWTFTLVPALCTDSGSYHTYVDSLGGSGYIQNLYGQNVVSESTITLYYLTTTETWVYSYV